MRRVLVVAAVLASLATPAQAATVSVGMRGLHFEPQTAHARIGDTVTWSNSASDRHSSTSVGPTPWDSGRLNPWGGRFSRVFPIAGAFPYYCTIHKSVGMTGRIIVATKVAPVTGTVGTDYVITLAKAGVKPPTGYAFVAQKALASGAYATLLRTSSASAHFRLTTPGTYKIRAGLQKTSGSLNGSWFSDSVTVTVH